MALLKLIDIYLPEEQTRSFRVGSASLSALCHFAAMCVIVASRFFVALSGNICAYLAPVFACYVPPFSAPILVSEITLANGIHVAHGPRRRAEEVARLLCDWE